MTPLQVGDRVAVYLADYSQGGLPARAVGVVDVINLDRVRIDVDDPESSNPRCIYAHRKQCRRLKPRAKVVKLTREEFALHWDNAREVSLDDRHLAQSSLSLMFGELCLRMGFK